MTEAAVRVDGLKELIRAVGKVDKSAAAELRKRLKSDVGGSFVNDVQQRIELRGLVKSGGLRGSIKPAVRGADVVIRSSPALRPGSKSRQGYAAIYEFGRGARRSFMQPTLDTWLATGKLKNELAGYLDYLETEFRS